MKVWYPRRTGLKRGPLTICIIVRSAGWTSLGLRAAGGLSHIASSTQKHSIYYLATSISSHSRSRNDKLTIGVNQPRTSISVNQKVAVGVRVNLTPGNSHRLLDAHAISIQVFVLLNGDLRTVDDVLCRLQLEVHLRE